MTESTAQYKDRLFRDLLNCLKDLRFNKVHGNGNEAWNKSLRESATTIENATAFLESQAKDSNPKRMPVCDHCGSDDVSLETSAVYWDMEAQCATVCEISAKGHYCNYCDGETTLKWIDISPQGEPNA